DGTRSPRFLLYFAGVTPLMHEGGHVEAACDQLGRARDRPPGGLQNDCRAPTQNPSRRRRSRSARAARTGPRRGAREHLSGLRPGLSRATGAACRRIVTAPRDPAVGRWPVARNHRANAIRIRAATLTARNPLEPKLRLSAWP